MAQHAASNFASLYDAYYSGTTNLDVKSLKKAGHHTICKGSHDQPEPYLL